MDAQIGIRGFLHESHSLAPRPATWRDFVGGGLGLLADFGPIRTNDHCRCARAVVADPAPLA